MSSGRIARHRDYEGLMARHERDMRIKRLSRLIVYVLIIIILICTFLALILIRQKNPGSQDPNAKQPAVSVVIQLSDQSLNG